MTMSLKRLLSAVALVALVPAAAPAAVHTQSAVLSRFGPRLGFSVSPDQVVLGGQVVIADVAPDLSFVPDLEMGFGDNQTVIGLNFDLHYQIRVQNTSWQPYAGAGLGVNFVSFDRPRPFRDESQTAVGGNLLFGASVPTQTGNRFFAEMKLGLGSDVPQFKMLAGWNFRL